MARTPVNWNPNRYGSVKHVLKFDATTGTYSLQEQNQSYNNTYSFTSLPSGNTQTQTSTNTNTQQTGTTSAQTTQAFGDVTPLYAKANDEDPFSAEYGKDGLEGEGKTELSGFFSPLDKAVRGEPVGSLGTRLKHQFENITGKTEQDWADVDTYIEREDMFNDPYKGKALRAKYGTFKDYDQALDQIQGKKGLLSFENVKSRMIDPVIDKTKSIFKTPGMMLIDAIAGEETAVNKHDKAYFTAYTSGSMAGRITGDDGTYDPANNLYHGMNKVSMHGNLEKAGEKRIARIEKTLARWEANPTKYADKLKNTTLYDRKEKFEIQQKDYKESVSKPKQEVIAKNLMTDSCFIAGTKISMTDGTLKNIENIIVGDKVKGYKEDNTVIKLDPTLLGTRKLYSFNNTEHYFFTSEHPFMTEEGWKSIKPEKTKERDGIELYEQLKGELKIGDKVITEDGPIEIIDIKSKEINDPEMPLYNFNVSNDNSYIADKYIVHNKGGKSIICTQMYQQTQLEDWKKTMQLWYIFQKKYLTMEHQEGYHFLFKPFVNGMKKSKVLTALGKHCAIARTNDIKHIMFGTPFSLSGRLVRLVTEPICYITGKIKSWL